MLSPCSCGVSWWKCLIPARLPPLGLEEPDGFTLVGTVCDHERKDLEERGGSRLLNGKGNNP